MNNVPIVEILMPILKSRINNAVDALEAQRIISATSAPLEARRNAHVEISSFLFQKFPETKFCWTLGQNNLLFRASSTDLKWSEQERLYLGVMAITSNSHHGVWVSPDIGTWDDDFGEHIGTITHDMRNCRASDPGEWWYTRISQGGYNFSIPVWGIQHFDEELKILVPRNFAKAGFDESRWTGSARLPVQKWSVPSCVHTAQRVSNTGVVEIELPADGDLPHHGLAQFAPNQSVEEYDDSYYFGGALPRHGRI